MPTLKEVSAKMPELKASPRVNPRTGAVADFLKYLKSPKSSQQMQGLMSVLPFVDDLETTLDRVSYGEPLTTGQGMTTALRPEAKGMVELATMFAPGGRFAKDAAVSALKSTKGFPVGMSIKDVGAPQEAALRLAQQRAALPVEKGGLGLPKNNTPMDRAEAMGFRTKDRMYHGTQEETITKFQPTRHDESAILGTSLARSPRIANFYAGGRSTKPAVEDAGNVIPVFVQGKKPQDFGKFVDYGLENNLFGRGRSNLDDTKNAYDYLEKKNLAGFDYKDLYGDEVQVVNPDRIRSVFAAFDPFRKTTATAVLYGVAAPDLLAAEQNPMDMLLQSLEK
jgi:hypothetical protein